MKSMKLAFVILAFLGISVTATAQRIAHVYPKHGTVVTTIHKPRVVVHQRIRYHYASGIWYKTRGSNFIVCAAPRGIVINTLPRGHKVMYVKGRKLYAYKGVRYQRTERGYKVVYV